MLMALIVLAINRLVWRPLYTVASTRFKLES
jgi:ABC-type anion transport system duplicated permease subunit